MTDLLPTFEKSEANLVREAMALPIDVKIRQAIGLLQMYEPTALRLNPAGYWLAYSGGKDSEVILSLAREAGVRHTAEYNVTTIDQPELVRFIKREHPEVHWNRPKKSMMARIVDRNPPTRLARWCCEEYKEHGGDGYAKVIGVRAAESARRAKLWKQVVPNRKREGGDTVYICPIVYWTDANVWAYHKLRGLKHCELYDQGMKRLGCIGCPLAGPKFVARQFARWPRYARNWERAVKKNWDIWHDVPRQDGKPRYQAGFASADEFWQWWRSGTRKTKVDECQAGRLFA